MLPVLVGVAAALAFFFLQKDLGPALFLSCVFLAMYAVARGRIPMAAAGLALLIAGFYLGYRLNVSDTLAARVQMWQSPWDNAVRGGDQVAQSLWALSTGGCLVPVSGSATRATCRRGIPISSSRPSARSWVLPASWRLRRCTR